MSSKAKLNPIIKYLKAAEFLSYCKANNVEVSENALESYEDAGLMHPIYRLIAPADYVKACFEDSYEKGHFNPEIPQKIKQQWQKLGNLRDSLSTYCFPPSVQFNNTIKRGHPLDSAYKKGNPFVVNPAKIKFLPWREYKIIVGHIEGYPQIRTTVEHFYAPWQIFVLAELNYFHTIEENYIVKTKRVWNLKKESTPSKIMLFSKQFQSISKLRMLKALIRADLIFVNEKKHVIEGEEYKELKKREEKNAKKIFRENVYSDWIKFLRKLTEIYYELQEKEKHKLAEELKRYIAITINMLMDSKGNTFKEISRQYSGIPEPVPGIYSIDGIRIYYHGLEDIFPNISSQIKERAHLVLKGYLKKYKENICADLGCSEIENELIDAIFRSGHDFLFAHIYNIEKEWFDRGPLWAVNIWAHIRSFVIALEAVSNEWFKANDFSSALNAAFGQELKKTQKLIRENCANLIAPAPAEYYAESVRVILGIKKNYHGICGPHVEVALRTRNYVAHNSKVENMLLGSTFLEIYECLIFTLISLFIRKNKLK